MISKLLFNFVVGVCFFFDHQIELCVRFFNLKNPSEIGIHGIFCFIPYCLPSLLGFASEEINTLPSGNTLHGDDFAVERHAARAYR